MGIKDVMIEAASEAVARDVSDAFIDIIDAWNVRSGNLPGKDVVEWGDRIRSWSTQHKLPEVFMKEIRYIIGDLLRELI